MNIYIDNECKCHVSNPNGTYTEVEAPERFIGKCPAYIEGFRYKPYGFTYTRNDGVSFGPGGESITPWVNLALLNRFQAQYDAQQKTINEYEVALTEIETALEVTSE